VTLLLWLIEIPLLLLAEYHRRRLLVFNIDYTSTYTKPTLKPKMIRPTSPAMKPVKPEDEKSG
jgi:hypothetical protein